MDRDPGDRVIRWAPLGLLAVSLLWIASKAVAPISDPDDWWHLRLGTDFLHQHSFAAPDRWSSFADQSWAPTEPLPEAVAALVHRWLGYPGLAWLFGVALVAVTVAVYFLNRQLATPLPAAVVTALAFLPMYGSMTSRPQLVSFVLLPVTIAAWIRTESDLRPRWWLVPMFWFWSLCHGFWFIGVAYGCAGVVAVVVGRRASLGRITRLAALAVASFGVVLLNPVGLGVIEAPFRVNGAAKYISEWQRPDLFSPGPMGAWLMIGLTLLIWVKTRRSVTAFQVLLLVSAAFWAWYAERTVIISALVSAPLLAGALEALINHGSTPVGRRGHVGRPEWKIIALAALVAAVGLAMLVPNVSKDPGQVPLALDAQLDRLPAGAVVLNDYTLGGWISWRHPDLNQYIDGLATPYSPQHDEDFHTIETQGAGWYGLVLDSGAPVALVESDSTLAHALESRGWGRNGTDAGFTLLSRPGVLG